MSIHRLTNSVNIFSLLLSVLTIVDIIYYRKLYIYSYINDIFYSKQRWNPMFDNEGDVQPTPAGSNDLSPDDDSTAGMSYLLKICYHY